MAGVKPHTNMALNGVMEDQTVEAELATLVSEYLQFYRHRGVRGAPRPRAMPRRTAGARDATQGMHARTVTVHFQTRARATASPHLRGGAPLEARGSRSVAPQAFQAERKARRRPKP